MKAKVAFYYDVPEINGRTYGKEALLKSLRGLSNVKMLHVDEEKKAIWVEITYEQPRVTTQDADEIKGEDFVD